MLTALWLMAAQGLIGAFDTFYYHEWKARLPARGSDSAPELKLHSGRAILYAVLFGTLPWIAWCGVWTWVLLAVLVAEIVLTLWDFVVEIAARKKLGDVYAGERVTHAIMGIIYGAMMAFLLPVLPRWWTAPTGLKLDPPSAPEILRWSLFAMAVGVFASGIRDLYAALGLPGGAWPWRSNGTSARERP
jgi:hypothetical protein